MSVRAWNECVFSNAHETIPLYMNCELYKKNYYYYLGNMSTAFWLNHAETRTLHTESKYGANASDVFGLGVRCEGGKGAEHENLAKNLLDRHRLDLTCYFSEQ